MKTSKVSIISISCSNCGRRYTVSQPDNTKEKVEEEAKVFGWEKLHGAWICSNCMRDK